MTKQEEIDQHNRKVLEGIVKKKKAAVIVEPVMQVDGQKIGAKEIRQAYFKNWYESCKDIYNKERRRKRKEKKKGGKGNG